MGRFAAAAAGSGSDVPPPAAALLLPKLRSDYAEFLDHGSPDRLGMLYPPTCVGFGTGACGARPRGFSRRHGICCFALEGFVSRLGLRGSRTCLAPGLRAFTGTSRTPHSMPFRVAARARARRRRYGNVGPLCIGYAFRPRLSPRLTLGGLASPRKPWACGGRVSRSSLATHASILASAPSTGGRPSGFAQRGTLPYRCSSSCTPPLRHHA